jgi:hypothetical protein
VLAATSPLLLLASTLLQCPLCLCLPPTVHYANTGPLPTCSPSIECGAVHVTYMLLLVAQRCLPVSAPSGDEGLVCRLSKGRHSQGRLCNCSGGAAEAHKHGECLQAISLAVCCWVLLQTIAYLCPVVTCRVKCCCRLLYVMLCGWWCGSSRVLQQQTARACMYVQSQ